MHFFSKFLGVLSLVAAAYSTTVSYDPGYDNPYRSLDLVSCSNGEYGLITRYGWTTQGEIPNFPFIGGAEAVTGYDSPNCGTCWSATFDGRTIYMLAIDYVEAGLNIALETMDYLTDGQAVALGRIDAEVSQVNISNCGIFEGEQW